MVIYAKPNQNTEFVRYNREFVITEFDCTVKLVIMYSVVNEHSVIMNNICCSFSTTFVTFFCGLQLKISLRMIFRVLRLEAFFQPQAEN